MVIFRDGDIQVRGDIQVMGGRSGVPLGFSKYSVPKLRKRPYGYLVEIRATRFRFA